ncbi:Uncharacterised protein [Klebsiella pneumoniae]|nr:Uncharacterised protein [Klebsiella pneumoniae]
MIVFVGMSSLIALTGINQYDFSYPKNGEE